MTTAIPQSQSYQSIDVNPLIAKRQKCEVWTRVMGYHRPVTEFNRGKQSEHYERVHFEQGVTEGNGRYYK